MATAIKLSDDLVKKAKQQAHIEHRTTPKQIELWAEVGRAALENPDLPIQFVLDSLYALKEAQAGLSEPYELH